MRSDINYFTTSDQVDIRYGIWRVENEKAGSVVLLNGRSEFIEKYAEPINRLNQRHFDVFTFDWRGQGLSTRLLPNRQKGYVSDFDDYLIDLKEIFFHIIKPVAVKPVIFLAHSMGGHVAIRFAHDFPGAVDQLILSAPMMDLHLKPLPKCLVRFLVRLMTAAGKAESYAMGSTDYNVENQQFRENKLTSDPDRFLDHVNAVKKNPDLALGGVTYGWLKAAFDSIDILRSKHFLKRIITPIIMAVAERDRVVSIEAQKKICAETPNCHIRIIKNAKHEILKETDEVQTQFWKEFDRLAVRK